jgi:hypothetical protein
MELVEVLSLGGRRQLMLVVCDGRRFLVGAGGDSVQSVTAMSMGIPASATAMPAGDGLNATAPRRMPQGFGADYECRP